MSIHHAQRYLNLQKQKETLRIEKLQSIYRYSPIDFSPRRAAKLDHLTDQRYIMIID